MWFSTRTTTRLAVVALALGLSIGCGRLHTAETEAGDVCSSATVYFSNESFDQAAVYVVFASQQTRIGTVMAGRTETLIIPSTQLSNGTVTLVARPLAHSTVASTGPISVHACDRLSVQLPSAQNTLVVLPPPP